MLTATRTIGARARHGAGHARSLASLSSGEKDALAGLAGRSLLRVDDYSKEELLGVLALSRRIKELHKAEQLPQAMAQKSVASIFQKRSTRTRVSTETGAAVLGGHSLFLSSQDIQLGVNETIQDSALVLSRFNSLILARVFGHSIVEELVQYSKVPVINALSDDHHPLQSLADYMTMQERFGVDNVAGKTITWVGDGNNVLHDLMLAAPALGMHVHVCTPEEYRPSPAVAERTAALAAEHGTKLAYFTRPLEAVVDASVIVTDTWVSMGQEEEAARRIRDFAGYQVDAAMMSAAAPDCIFMHCLPRHAEEVTDAVFYSDRSVVFDEAENRMYTVMAVMCSMLGKTDCF